MLNNVSVKAGDLWVSSYFLYFITCTIVLRFASIIQKKKIERYNNPSLSPRVFMKIIIMTNI